METSGTGQPVSGKGRPSTYCSFNKNLAGLLILMQCINRLYLYTSVRRWSCRRASNVGHFNLTRSSVMLACCRGPTPNIHLMAWFWIFSKAYLYLLVCGSHMVAAYSAVDLTRLKYAVCFSCSGHFLRFLWINPRRLLHLFAVIVMWSEKCRDLCNKMPM